LLPGFLEIDPDDLVNWRLFEFMLLSNGIVFVVILYLMLLLPLGLMTRHWHWQIIAHCLRFYALMNVCVAILFVLSVNRLIVKGSFLDPTSAADLIVGGCVALIVFGITLRVLLMPIARYIRIYYHPVVAYVGGFTAVVLASVLNPVMASDYFSHVIEDEDFCSAVVSVRYRQELGSGEYSRDCLVAHCMALRDSRRGVAKKAAVKSCPVLRVD
jgi:hypothetical protein